MLLKSLDCSQEEARIKKKKRVLILPFSKISKTHTHIHEPTDPSTSFLRDIAVDRWAGIASGWDIDNHSSIHPSIRPLDLDPLPPTPSHRHLFLILFFDEIPPSSTLTVWYPHWFNIPFAVSTTWLGSSLSSAKPLSLAHIQTHTHIQAQKKSHPRHKKME